MKATNLAEIYARGNTAEWFLRSSLGSGDFMSGNRRMRLGHEEAWERGFATHKKFKAREGNCQVSVSHLEGTFKLGQWVSVQRYFKDTMTPNRKRRLDAIGFVWDRAEGLWANGGSH
jgi:hypothetical protein